jgi:hypothetical protein
LCFDGKIIYLYNFGCELYSEGGFMVFFEVEFGVSEEDAGLADAWMGWGVLESPMMMYLKR